MKNVKKIITSMVLVVAICFMMVPAAFAAGVETWYSGTTYKESFTFTDTNLTPVKTIGTSGTLCINLRFTQYDAAQNSPIRLTLQIRDATTGAVLESTSAKDTYYPNTYSFLDITCHLEAGRKVQLFFDASSDSNPPGYFRSARVTYQVYINS